MIFLRTLKDAQERCAPMHITNYNIRAILLYLLLLIAVPAMSDFYHGDHLGSANWITDYSGTPIQYYHYAPYGELIEKSKSGLYDERYKFTGKERDAESGYDYYGARYLWSTLGHWLSVDPMADKYPWISPYAYCEWNPIKFIDPDGRKIVVRGRNFIERFAAKLGVSIGYVKQVENDLAQLKLDNKDIGNMITTLEKSGNVHIIRFPENRWNKSGPLGDKKGTVGRGSIIEYDPNNYETKTGDRRTPRVGLAHEAKHSFDFDSGNETDAKIDGVKIMEIEAINMENKIRKVTGDEKRTTYGDKEINSALLE